MKNPFVKTKCADPRRCGRLITPTDDLRNDSELYNAVSRDGRALVMTDGVLTEISAEEFLRDWMGD